MGFIIIFHYHLGEYVWNLFQASWLSKSKFKSWEFEATPFPKDTAGHMFVSGQVILQEWRCVSCLCVFPLKKGF